MRLGAFTCAFVVVLAFAERGWACASCACGDPTITGLGTEKPFAGRLRLALSTDWRVWTDGSFIQDQDRMDSLVATGTVAYAPTSWLVLGASVPLSARRVDGPAQHIVALGTADASLDGRAVFFSDRHNQLAVTAGLLLPTALPAFDKRGKLLVDDAQPGNGDVGADAGLFYGFTRAPFALFTSVRGVVAAPVTLGIAPGPAVLADVAAQFQPLQHVAVLVGADGRAALPGKSPGGPFGDGVATFLMSGVLWRTSDDVVVSLVVRVPAIEVLPQGVRERSAVSASVAVDL